MVAVPMGVWVGSARRWLASGMGVCPRRQERAATIPYPPRDRKPGGGLLLTPLITTPGVPTYSEARDRF